MYWFILLLGIITFIFGIVPIFFTLRFRAYVINYFKKGADEYRPKISIILPCKGIDPGFEDNLTALLNQDYPDFELVCVAATDDDPAYVFINSFMQQRSISLQLKLIVAGISTKRSQKVNNLLQALKKCRSETEVFVFVDSDIRPNKRFLANLVNPLQNSEVGAATGIRWYLPNHATAGSMLISVWAAGALPMMIDKHHNFAFGGANAIKKEVFEKAGIEKLLKGSLSDTFSITRGVKEAGLLIRFVPHCIVVSHEDSTIKETVEWSTRQTIITRVYSKPFWWTVFLTYSFSNAMLLTGILLIIISMISKSAYIVPAFFMLSLIPLEVLNVAMLISVVKYMIPEHIDSLNQFKFRYYFYAPFTSLLIMLNSIVSIFTNEITWRGVKYKLISPEETKIL